MNIEKYQPDLNEEQKGDHLEELFSRVAGLKTEAAEYRRGHGIQDHTRLVAERCKYFAKQLELGKNDRFALYITGLAHDIIQPEQTPRGSELEHTMETAWGYKGQGDDSNEERESARFLEWYIDQPHVKEKMKEYGIQINNDLKNRMAQAVRTTGGKVDLEAGKFIKPDGTEVDFNELDDFEQAVFLSDKMTGAEPSTVFDGLAKLVNLYHTTEHDPQLSLKDFVVKRFKFHLGKRERFFSMLREADKNKLGVLEKVPEEELERIWNNVQLQRELIEELEHENTASINSIITLADKFNRERIDKGDIRGINGFTLMKEWYHQEKENDDPVAKKLIRALRKQPSIPQDTIEDSID